MIKGPKKLFSRYSLRYPRSLIYMLQAVEYNVRDYFAWLHRVDDFAKVEKRKKLTSTPKAIYLLVCAWLIELSLLWLSIYTLLLMSGSQKYLLTILILLFAPYVLAYAILIPLVFFRIIIQLPIEYLIIRKTSLKLKSHSAIKIGIAGSFGKTTMREIVKTVLAEGKKVAAAPHTYNTPLGISKFVKTLNGDEDILIFELGENYPGDVRKLCELTNPTIGIITGINEAHLVKFKSLESTIKTIYELADYLGDKLTYVNDESELARENARSGHVLYSRERIDKFKIENPKSDLVGTSFSFVAEDSTLELHSKLLGLHQIGPLSVAADLGLKLGLSLEQIKVGISKTAPFEHRLEPKTDSAGVTTLDDSYNGNPDGARAVIEFLGSLKDCRRIYVTPGLVEIGSASAVVHERIGRTLAKAKIEKVILIKNSATPYIEKGLKAEGYSGEIIWFDDALAAFGALPHMTVRGDVVLLQNDWSDQYE